MDGKYSVSPILPSHAKKLSIAQSNSAFCHKTSVNAAIFLRNADIRRYFAMSY